MVEFRFIVIGGPVCQTLFLVGRWLWGSL